MHDFLRDEIVLFPRSRNGNAPATYKHYKQSCSRWAVKRKEQFPALFGPLTHAVMTSWWHVNSWRSRSQHAFKAPTGGCFDWTASISRKCRELTYQSIYSSHIWFFLDESGCPANLLVSTCLLQQGMAYVAGECQKTGCYPSAVL